MAASASTWSSFDHNDAYVCVEANKPLQCVSMSIGGRATPFVRFRSATWCDSCNDRRMVSDDYVGPFQKSGDFGWSLPVILILFSSSVVGYLVVVFFATQFGPLPAEGTRRLAGYFAIVGAAMGLTLPLSMRMRWPLKLVSGLTAGTAAGAAAWTLMTMVSHY